ncbi:MAG: hypothetical protein AB7U83_18425 [Vicinamibacterales bacterium]
MASGVAGSERRQAPRRAAAAFGLEYRGQLRPGTPVVVLSLSATGALLESAAPFRPGSATELHLDSPDGRRRRAAGEVLRCWVASVAPLRFRSAVGFQAPADLYGSRDPGSG